VIQGYPRQPSVRPGDTLTLHVSTDQPHFRVEVYRQGAQLLPMGRLGPERLPGHLVPAGPPDRDWGWPAYAFPVPSSWPSGVYIAMLVEIDVAGGARAPDVTTADGTEAKALFIVRSPAPGVATSILFKLAWATYHAYNGTGYGSLYTEAVWTGGESKPGFTVTTRRPGGGTGGVVMYGDSPDYYDQTSRRQTFSHWEAPFVRWLEANGYPVDYATDWDLQVDSGLLAPYALMLSVGHDEYWSDEMRARIEAFIRQGGNVAFFSGNICGYRIHFGDGDSAFTCAKVRPSGKDRGAWELDNWSEVRPENGVTGTSIRQAGGWWDGRRDTVGYTVQHAAHWVYADTGLKDGEVFGADPQFPLVGYEADGATFTRKDGLAVVTGDQGTPQNFFILGIAELGEGWVRGGPHAAATMGTYTSDRGGIVFNGATTDWPCLVGRNAEVARITRNVLDRLRLRAVPILGPLPARHGRMLAVAGELARFHVDLAGLPAGASAEGRRYTWEVLTDEPVPAAPLAARAGAGFTFEARMPRRPVPVTVTVTVSERGGPVAFGTLTFVPLSEEAALKVEVTALLREMVMPGEPSNPLVHPTAEAASRTWMLYSTGSVRLPWLEERATRLAEMVRRLRALGRGRPGERDPDE
jgi:N,N-dimethylformamidase beta subunit-like, C-terminal